MSTTITTDLSAVITKATEKATASETGANESLVLDSQIKAAEERAESAEKQLDTASTSKAESQDKLSPPPMKTEPGEGKKAESKKVVDQKEVDKINSDIRAADATIQQAHSAVDAAHQEATDLTSKKASAAEVTPQEKGSMDDVTKQLDDLKKMAKDPNTDLTGQDYQKKLNAAVKSTEDLYGSLPENADTAEFWKNTTASFKELDAAMVEYLDIDAPPINSTNNYSEFFAMSQQQFGSLITALGDQGIDQALIIQLQGAQDSITNQSGVYLGGVSESDKELMGEMLRQTLVINDNLAKDGPVTNEDIAKLLEVTNQTSEMLAQGGSQSGAVNANVFVAADRNLEYIDAQVEDPGFDEFAQSYEAFINANDPEDLQGISAPDMQTISDYNDQVRAAKDKLASGATLTQAEIDALVANGESVIDLMTTRYGLSDGTEAAGGTSNNLSAPSNVVS